MLLGLAVVFSVTLLYPLFLCMLASAEFFFCRRSGMAMGLFLLCCIVLVSCFKMKMDA